MRDRLIQLVALVVLAVGVLSAFMLTPSINQQRIDRQLTYDIEAGDGSNPAYTAMAALGSFRGVLINAAWQRSEALKQEGKFYESNNLAETITTLQPRFPEAWNIQAWNMAYNISVKCQTAEERWDWVYKGMALLRDRGIPSNPNAVVLYRSIAWILGHKMTGQTDDMHWYYKARTAEEWQILLGAPDLRAQLKAEYRSPDKQPSEEAFDPLIHLQWLATLDMKRIADAAEQYLRKPERKDEDFNAANYFQVLSPNTTEQFFADNPGLRGIIAELEQISGPNGEDLNLGLNSTTLRALGRLQLFSDAGYPVDSPAIDTPQTLGIEAMALRRWLSSRDQKVMLNFDPRIDNLQAREAKLKEQDPDARIIDLVPMIDLLRALTLVSEYHMDPAYMHACMERFGPMDWRHPAAHAAYWTALGSLRAEQWTQRKDRVDFINANRAIIHSMQHLSHAGKVTYRPRVEALGQFGEEIIDAAPDTRMIPAYEEALDDVMAKIEAGEFGEKHQTRTDTYRDGHENFLQAAVYLYFFEGKEDLARKYYDRVRELYGDREDSVNAAAGEYNLSLRDFAIVRMEDDLGFQEVAAITRWIRLAWTRGLDRRSQQVMKLYLDAGKKRYDAFLADRQTEIRGDSDVQARQAIPPFDQLVLQQFVEMMGSPRHSLVQRSSIWRLAAPLLAQLSDERPLVYEAYAMFLPMVSAQAQAEGWSVDILTAFSEPRGFREWYQENLQNQEALPSPLRRGAQP